MATLTPHARPVAESHSPEVFHRIAEPGIELVCWRRRPRPNVLPAIDALLRARTVPSFKWESPSLEAIIRSLASILPSRSESIAGLADDIHSLARWFQSAVGVCASRIRFERVEDGGCRLFHVDSLHARMLCTYAGPGTEWVPNEFVCRDQLGSRGRDIDTANAAIVPDASRIQRLHAWEVALFKGRLWPGDEASALVHRSAPVAGPSEHRIRLCIDARDACAC